MNAPMGGGGMGMGMGMGGGGGGGMGMGGGMPMMGMGMGMGMGAQASAAAPAPAASGLDLLGGLGGPAAADPMAGFGGMGGMSALTPAPPLASLNIAVTDVQPGTFPPATIHDQNNVRVLLNFARNPPHPTICVVVVTMLNLGGVPVNNIQFQAAVPKSLEVKLQPPSASTIPPAGITGPQVATQIMLLSNPSKAPIKIRFKLSYNVNGTPVDQMGECGSFPSM